MGNTEFIVIGEPMLKGSGRYPLDFFEQFTMHGLGWRFTWIKMPSKQPPVPWIKDCFEVVSEL
jgi:hypothetical protein